MEVQASVDLHALGTEEGVSAAAVTMAKATCEAMLWPVVQQTPPAMRQVLFERYLCALTGALVAEVGPERAQETLDAVKLAISDFQVDRSRAH